jgi:hypothetical protein
MHSIYLSSQRIFETKQRTLYPHGGALQYAHVMPCERSRKFSERALLMRRFHEELLQDVCREVRIVTILRVYGMPYWIYVSTA